jgi:hypothetical protein
MHGETTPLQVKKDIVHVHQIAHYKMDNAKRII